MTLRRQFAVVLAAFAFVLAVVFGALTWRIASDALESELDRRLVQIGLSTVAVNGFSPSIISRLEPGDETSDLELAYVSYQNRLDSLRTLVDDALIFRADENESYRNLVAADATILIGEDLTPRLGLHSSAIDQARGGRTSTTRIFRDDDGRPVKFGFIQLDPTEDADVIMALLISADDFNQPLAWLGRTLSIGTALGVLIAVVVSGVLARTIANPLERLSRVALRIQRGHMNREVAVEPGEEVGRLSRAMERMRLGVLERDDQLRLMLAQVAHEIRNPLGGLELFAAAAAETEDVAERKRLMDRVRGEVGALNRIIDDFLAFARPVGRDQAAVDVRTPVKEAVELAQGSLEEQGIILHVDVANEALLAIADEDRVKRAVLNLLRNAGEAAESSVTVGARLRGSEIEIVVSDDGPGVPQELRERVFEPFYTDKEKGAGLGLSIVRKFVESSGGRVEVGSGGEDGAVRGAEFRVYLPGLEEPPPNHATLQRAR